MNLRPSICLLVLGLSAPLACTDDGEGTEQGTSETSGDGDGDTSGDGDGDTSGDGDGDTSGDGDGDTSGDGDGDGDTSGDGDGDTSGDGDGDTAGDGDGGVALPPNFVDELTVVSSCGDIFIGLTNPEATVGLFFNAPELAALAHDLGEPQVVSEELPADGYSVQVLLGSDLDETCTDTGPGPTITSEWSGTSGTVDLTVTPFGEPQPWEMPANATLELSNIALEGQGLEPAVIETLSVVDAYVGWLPG